MGKGMNKDDYTFYRYWFGEWLNGWAAVTNNRGNEWRDEQLRILIACMGGMAGEW